MKVMRLKLIVFMAGDGMLALFAFFTGLMLRFGYHETKSIFFTGPFSRPFLFAFVLLLISYILESYDISKHRREKEIFINILITVICSFIILSTIFFLAPGLMIGRGVLSISLLAFVFYQFVWHLIYITAFDHPLMTERIIVLGTGPMAARIGELIQTSKNIINHTLAGYIACESEKVLLAVPKETILDKAHDLLKTAQNLKASKIIVALSERRGVFPLREVLRCKLKGVEIVDSPAFFEQVLGKLMVESMTPSWIIFSTGFRRSTLIAYLKRAIDILLSIIGIIFSLSLFPFIALLVKIDSHGPIFFSQLRVGDREEEFVLYKFRTMPQNAESKTGAVWAQKDDPRIRPIGRFLRKFRLDELPQLYNVLRGDMSFVGPRPERPEFVEKLKEVIPFYSKRHFIKPGITGWAQVRYPYGSSVEDAVEKLCYDLYYVKNMSPLLDTLIVLQTFKVVIFGRGGR